MIYSKMGFLEDSFSFSAKYSADEPYVQIVPSRAELCLLTLMFVLFTFQFSMYVVYTLCILKKQKEEKKEEEEADLEHYNRIPGNFF